MPESKSKKARIISVDVNAISMDIIYETLKEWINLKVGKYICVTGAHGCVESNEDKKIQLAHNSADIVVPDGRPVFWMLRLLGNQEAQHIRGFDLIGDVCNFCEKNNYTVGFYGGAENVIKKSITNVKVTNPNLNIRYLFSPPFRNLENIEEEKIVKDINSSGVNILFVALGCPKQELWMNENINKLNCVCIGVGAAVNYLAGDLISAPKFLQVFGLEWLFRLIIEPKRLYKRYFKIVPKFMYLSLIELIKLKFFNKG